MAEKWFFGWAIGLRGPTPVKFDADFVKPSNLIPTYTLVELKGYEVEMNLTLLARKYPYVE